MPYINSEFGVKRIGLFGSFSTGEPDEKSDVDIIAEFEKPVGLRFIEFTEYLEQLLGRRIDVLSPAGIEGIRNREIAKEIEGTIVYV